MLNSIIFWILYIGIPALTIAQLNSIGERVNKISLVTAVTVALYFFSVLGTLPLFYFIDAYRYYMGVQDRELITKVLFFSGLNIALFLYGYKLFMTRGNPQKNEKHNNLKPLNKKQEIALWAMFFICIATLFFYLGQIDRIAILTALKDGAEAAVKARSDMGSSFDGKYHWYKLIIVDVGNFIFFTVLALWLTQKKRTYLVLTIAIFFFCAFVAVMTTEKAPFVWLLVGIFIVYTLSNKDGIVSPKLVIALAVTIILALVTAYLLFMGSTNIYDALWRIFSRTFSGSITPAYFYLQFFPEIQPYLLGKTLPNPASILPFEPYLYTIEIMNWKYPEMARQGIVSSAPTAFWGEAYANFGPIGIPAVAFLVGGVIAKITDLISRQTPSPLTVGLTTWLILFFKDLSVSGFSSHLFSIYPIFIAIFFVFINSLRSKEG